MHTFWINNRAVEVIHIYVILQVDQQVRGRVVSNFGDWQWTRMRIVTKNKRRARYNQGLHIFTLLYALKYQVRLTTRGYPVSPLRTRLLTPTLEWPPKPLLPFTPLIQRNIIMILRGTSRGLRKYAIKPMVHNSSVLLFNLPSEVTMFKPKVSHVLHVVSYQVVTSLHQWTIR